MVAAQRRRATRSWAPRPHVAVTVVLVGLLTWGDRADADPVPAAAPATRPRLPPTVRDLDGTYVWLGPTGGVVRVDGAWDSAWGGGVQVVRVRERAALGVVGAWLGGVHYAARDGGRISLEAVAGTRRGFGRMLGIAVGPALELGASRHPRLGGSATAWLFAGFTPYARVGGLVDTGAFIELGVAFNVPAWRH